MIQFTFSNPYDDMPQFFGTFSNPCDDVPQIFGAFSNPCDDVPQFSGTFSNPCDDVPQFFGIFSNPYDDLSAYWGGRVRTFPLIRPIYFFPLSFSEWLHGQSPAVAPAVFRQVGLWLHIPEEVLSWFLSPLIFSPSCF